MKRKMAWVIVTTLIVSWINRSIGLAWGAGWLAVLLRRLIRYGYVGHVQVEQSFKIMKYLLYTGLSFFIALAVVGLAIYFKEHMNPYVILLVYVIDYILILIDQYKWIKI